MSKLLPTLFIILLLCITFLPIKAEGLLQLGLTGTTPEGISLKIDDTVYDTWPDDRLQLPDGEHHLRVSKEGYLQFTRSFRIENDDVTRIVVQLLPNTLEVNLMVASDTEITLDGRFLSTGPWNGRLKKGFHHIALARPHHIPCEYTIMVEAGNNVQTISLPDLRPVNYQLSIQSDPAGAAISLDGEPLDLITPALIEHLSPGLHIIELRKRGYGILRQEVTIGDKDTSLPVLKLDKSR